MRTFGETPHRNACTCALEIEHAEHPSRAALGLAG
jgi:hypothetical protein